MCVHTIIFFTKVSNNYSPAFLSSPSFYTQDYQELHITDMKVNDEILAFLSLVQTVTMFTFLKQPVDFKVCCAVS